MAEMDKLFNINKVNCERFSAFRYLMAKLYKENILICTKINVGSLEISP